MKNTLTKKSLSIIMTLLMIISAVPLTSFNAFALELSADGLWRYEVIDNTATLTCLSYDDAYFGSPSYIGEEKDVIVPNKIDGYTVTGVGDRAFLGCTSLTSITIPDSVTSIGSSAFAGCTSLESVTIPDSVTSIDGYAFSGCTSLTSIIIPDSVTSIGFNVFPNETEVTVEYNPEFDYSNFMRMNINISRIVISEGITKVNNGAFYNWNGLKSVEIPSGVTKIGRSAFFGCTALESVTIPATVTKIINDAFYGCYSLETIKGYSGTYAEEFALKNDFNFVALDAEAPENFEYTVENDYAVITGYNGTSETVLMPSTLDGYRVIRIDEAAFTRCNTVKSIIIPKSIIKISDFAFLRCANLKSVTFLSEYTFIGEDAFTSCTQLSTVYGYLDSYAESFAANHGYNFIYIDDITAGDINADGLVSLEDYSMGKQYVSGANSFSSYQKVAFDYNDDGAKDAFDLFYINKIITGENISNFEYSIISGNNVQITGYSGSDIRVEVPANIDGYSVTSVYNYAFKNNKIVKVLKISSGITSIKYGAFLNCTSLETVELSNTITTIGSNAFKGCTNLTKITIPDSVTSIQATSFVDCPNITIYGTAGSYAETFANNNSINFVAI